MRTVNGDAVVRVRRPIQLLALTLALVMAGMLAGCGAFSFDLDLFSSDGPGDGGASGGGTGMGTISVHDLPPEATTTLELIENEGPFPYAKDGTVFHNYEGLLPKKTDGYYREYTVVTPGSRDRGARRIVAGRDGERYYTDDHYNSFRLVVDS